MLPENSSNKALHVLGREGRARGFLKNSCCVEWVVVRAFVGRGSREARDEDEGGGREGRQGGREARDVP